jgi:hypothetical protein
MLCRLAVRRVVSSDDTQAEYVLRVAGEPMLGSAGTLRSDERTFSGQDELEACLRSLGVSDQTLTQFEVTARQPASSVRFVVLAEREQIAFERLQDADFDIFID